jgi:hypothetical protein
MKKTLLFLLSSVMTAGLFAENIPFDAYGNVLLSDYENYADNQIVKITLSISDSTGTGIGWGVGTIKPINNASAATAYTFNSQAVSPEGALNVYEISIAQLKEFAKIDGVYYEDSYGQKGITINVYNAASRVSISIESAPSVGASFDFEADAIGTVYETLGYNTTAMSATVTANPAVAGEKSLHLLADNYRTYAKFGVALPAGKTLADIEKITFDIYFNHAAGETDAYPQNRYKAIDCLIGEVGTTFTIDAPTISIGNFIGDEQEDRWISKVIPLITPALNPPLSESLLALNTFDFAIGINHSKIDFYLDNIVFVEVPSSVKEIAETNLRLKNTDGGIIIDANNEQVTIFGIDGRFIKNAFANNEKIALNQGIYIVKVGNKTLKAVVR